MKHKVEPIKQKSQLKLIEEHLKIRNKRNRLVFVLGINSGLRVSDILNLLVGDVKNKTHLEIIEKKTGKYKKIFINNKVKKLIQEFIQGRDDSEPLFLSQKKHKLDRSQVYRFLNKACTSLGITENIGTHTMRKTFGYHHYQQFKDIAILQKIFNHSSPSITLRYIGIEQEEIDESYKHFEL